ncbi:MAG: acyl-CoA dehydrogenase family protein [Sphingomonadales bacterium]
MLFTDQHRELRRSLRRLIDTEINPFVEEWEGAEIFPAHEVFGKLGAAGFLGINKPEEYGGLGLDYSYALAAIEELGHIRCGGVPMAIGVQTDMATPALARYGSHELKQEFLTPSISGEFVACLGVSEPQAGSDVAAIKTFARRDGDDYVISGTKMWTTSGTQADWMCLLANTGDGDVHTSKSLICLPMKTKGVEVTRKLKKLGMWCSDTAQIFLDEVRVPRRYLIGAEGMGFVYQMQQFQEERLWAAAQALLGMEELIEDTVEYTRERKIFGRSVLDNQVVNFSLAELQTEIEALRSLVYRAAELHIGGEDVTMLASMAKLKAGRLARQVGDTCLQYWGGMGFMWESRTASFYRDARLTSIGGGADEVMLSIITKLSGTAPSRSKTGSKDK